MFTSLILATTLTAGAPPILPFRGAIRGRSMRMSAPAVVQPTPQYINAPTLTTGTPVVSSLPQTAGTVIQQTGGTTSAPVYISGQTIIQGQAFPQGAIYSSAPTYAPAQGVPMFQGGGFYRAPAFYSGVCPGGA